MSLNDVDGKHPASQARRVPTLELVVTIWRTGNDLLPSEAYRKVVLPLTPAQEIALKCDGDERIDTARAYLRTPEGA